MLLDLSSITSLKLQLESDSITAVDGDIPTSWVDRNIIGVNHGVIYRKDEFYGQPGLDFNGIDAYIDLGTPLDLEIYNEFTIFAVTKTTTDPGISPSCVISKDLHPFDKGYGLGIAPGGSFFMDFGGNDWFSPVGSSLIDGKPHIQRLSYSNGSWRPAIDGIQLIDFSSSGPLADPNEHWNIGRCARLGDPRYYKGLIAVILVCNSRLSDADIVHIESKLFNKYIPPPSIPIPYTVQISPSGENVILSYMMPGGVTEGKVIGAIDGITLNVNNKVVTPSTLSWCSRSPALASKWLFGTLAKYRKYSQMIDNESMKGFTTPFGIWAIIPSILQDPGGEYFHNTAVGYNYTRSSSIDATAIYTFIDLTPGLGMLLHCLWDFIDFDRTINAIYTVRDGSGTLLGVASLDQTAVIGPNNFDLKYADRKCKILLRYNLAEGQDTIIVTVTNGARSGYLICDALIVKSIPVPIAVPGDTVTIDIPANSVTLYGLSNPRDVVGREVTFAEDNDIAPFDPYQPRTMIIGVNKAPSGTDGLALVASNRGFSVGGWSGDDFGGSVIIDQLSGEIISMSGLIGTKLWDSLGQIGSGIPTINDGDSFRLEFDYFGVFDEVARAGQSFFCEGNASVTKNADGYESLGGTRWRLTATYHTAPWLPLSKRAPYFYEDYGVTRGTWFVIDSPVHNISFFDRYTPVGDTRYAHPTLHNRFGGTGMIWRAMDLLNTNGSMTTGVSDFWPEAVHFRSPSNKLAIQPIITRIRGFIRDPVADPDHVFELSQNPPSSYYAIVVVEVNSTAGMLDGQIWTPSPVPPDFPSAAGGSNPLVHVEQGTAYVTGSTTVLFLVGYGGGPDGSPMPASIAEGADWVPVSGTATLYSFHGTDAPIIFAKCVRELGLLPYYTLGYLLTDAGAIEWAHLGLDNTDPGTKVRYELFNEVWNSTIVQEAWGALLINMNRRYAIDPITQPLTFRTVEDIYVWKSNHFRQIIKAEYIAAGRGNDLVWIVGGLAGDTGITGNIASWGSVQSPPVAVDFDEFAIDTYQNLDGAPFEIATNAIGGLAEVCNRLGVGGSIDLLTLCTVLGSREALTKAHREILDSYGYSHVKIVSYEGLWNDLVGHGTVDAENTLAEWSQTILRHHRMNHLSKANFQYLQRIGYGFVCRYEPDYYGGLGRLAWCDYSTPIQLNGTGDPFENTNPWDISSLVSQTGGAIREWALGVKKPSEINSRRRRQLVYHHNLLGYQNV